MFYSTEKFTYTPYSTTFITEASTLGLPVGSVPNQLKLQSKRTGKVVDFHFVKTQKDVEGDILSWEYKLTYPREQSKHLVNMKVVVIND